MPTYVYRCNECDFTFEARQRMSEDPLELCPECEEESLRRVINSVGIVFKGSGFYVTDNRGRKNGSSNGSTAEGAATTETPEKKSEPKAEKTPEKKSEGSTKSD